MNSIQYIRKRSFSVVFLIGLSCLSLNALSVTFVIPSGEDIVGQIIKIRAKKDDTLGKIGQRFNVGPREMIQANPGIKPNRLKLGQVIKIPQLFIMPMPDYRQGIVINIPELRLYHFSNDGQQVSTFPVALGRSGWRTPTLITSVRNKKEKPSWYVPESIKRYTYNKTGHLLPDVVGPGPRNPLGNYAIYLERRRYLIHGTNNPNSIGTLASSGCIRMYNTDIERLFQEVAPGDPVSIIHHAYKAGWRGKTLYLEAHKPVSHNESITSLNHTSVDDVIMHAIFYRQANIDWDKVKTVIHRKTGIPQPIGFER